jgi:hypothetical protein
MVDRELCRLEHRVQPAASNVAQQISMVVIPDAAQHLAIGVVGDAAMKEQDSDRGAQCVGWCDDQRQRLIRITGKRRVKIRQGEIRQLSLQRPLYAAECCGRWFVSHGAIRFALLVRDGAVFVRHRAVSSPCERCRIVLEISYYS